MNRGGDDNEMIRILLSLKVAIGCRKNLSCDGIDGHSGMCHRDPDSIIIDKQPTTAIETSPCHRSKLCDKEYKHVGGCNKKKEPEQCSRSKYCNRSDKHGGSCNKKNAFYVESDVESSSLESSDDEFSNEGFGSCTKNEICDRPKGHCGWCRIQTSKKRTIQCEESDHEESSSEDEFDPCTRNEICDRPNKHGGHCRIKTSKKKRMKPKKKIMKKPKKKIMKPKKKTMICCKKCMSCNRVRKIKFSDKFFTLCEDCIQQTKCYKNPRCASICDSNGSHYGVCKIRDYAEKIGKVVITEESSSCMDGNSYHYIGRIIGYEKEVKEYAISWIMKFDSVTKVPSDIPGCDKLETMAPEEYHIL